MKFTLSLLAVFLFINAIFAAEYSFTFEEGFQGAINCIYKDFEYINKVSGNVRAHNGELVVVTAEPCNKSIQDNIRSVCKGVRKGFTCQ